MCENVFDENMLKTLAKAWKGCPSLQCSKIHLSVKTPSSSSSVSNHRRDIVDESFGVFNLTNYIKKLIYPIGLTFTDLKGFDIESLILVNSKLLDTSINFYTRFNLYKQNRLIEGCQEFKGSNSRGFVFRNQDPRSNDIYEFFFNLKSKQKEKFILKKKSFVLNTVKNQLKIFFNINITL